jgi:hypothetical protein
MTATIIRSNRWQIERTRPRPGDIIMGNSTRPAMLVAADGQLIERGAKR